MKNLMRRNERKVRKTDDSFIRTSCFGNQQSTCRYGHCQCFLVCGFGFIGYVLVGLANNKLFLQFGHISNLQHVIKVSRTYSSYCSCCLEKPQWMHHDCWWQDADPAIVHIFRTRGVQFSENWNNIVSKCIRNILIQFQYINLQRGAQ